MEKSIFKNVQKNYGQLIDELRNLATTLLSGCLEELHEKAKDPSFRCTLDGAELYRRFNALDAFLQSYDKISTAYTDEVVNGINYFQIPDKGNTPEIELNNLALVDSDELDVDLAIKRIVHNAEEAQKESLLHIELRLEELGQLLPRQFDCFCLHPGALYLPFQDTVLSLDIEAEAKVLLCEIFEYILSSKFRTFYQQINQRLIERGILAEQKSLERVIRDRERVDTHSPSRPKHNSIDQLSRSEFIASVDTDQLQQTIPTSSETPRSIPAQVGDSLPARAQYMDDASLRVLHRHFALESDPIRSKLAAGTSEHHYPASRSDLFQALNYAQRDIKPFDTLLDPTAFREAINHALTSVAPATTHKPSFADSITSREEKVIDFVNLIFTTIFTGEALTNAAKNLILKLQIPILKLTLLDFNIIQQANHPARDIVNILFALGMKVEDPSQPLFQKLVGVVDTIVDEFDTDTTPFINALEHLKKIDYMEAEQVEKTEQRSRKEAQINARHTAAKRKVVSCLRRYVDNRPPPNKVLEFIVKCWAPYMGAICLTLSTQSRKWEQAKRDARKIIEATRPERTFAEVDQLIGSDCAFFDRLHNQLCQLPWFQSQHQDILSNMRQWFDTLFERLSSESEQQSDPALMGSLSTEELLPEMAEEEIETKLVVTRANIPPEVTPGTWFEIYRGKDRAKRRLKLSAILEDTGQLLFADRLGSCDLKIDLDCFLQDLQDGRTKLIDDSNVFDRALKSVIKNIRENQDRQACA